MLPAPDLPPRPYSTSFSDKANKHAAYACHKATGTLPRPHAWPVRLPQPRRVHRQVYFVARSNNLFRPHSLGCGISSLCCIVCVPSPGKSRTSVLPEYQSISTELRSCSKRTTPPMESLCLRRFGCTISTKVLTLLEEKSRNLRKTVVFL